VQMEGVVVKALNSEWRMNDRVSNSWLKIKPDYITQLDIDAVIIGGHFGTGRHGRKVSEYLLGLAETPRTASAEPSRFVSFCRWLLPPARRAMAGCTSAGNRGICPPHDAGLLQGCHFRGIWRGTQASLSLHLHTQA
jgi:hypothetical protein